MRSAEWTRRASSSGARTPDRPLPVNSAFRIPHSALARRRSVARYTVDGLPRRRSHAARHLLSPRSRSPHPAGASLRAAPPRRGRALARHGLAGGVRPAALRARQPAGRRVVRRPRHDLRAGRARLVARAVPAELGRDHRAARPRVGRRSEEHTSELQSRLHLVCRLLLEKKKKKKKHTYTRNKTKTNKKQK